MKPYDDRKSPHCPRALAHHNLLHIGTAIVGIFFIKSTFEIEIWVIHRLHNGVVNIRIFHTNPTD